MTPKAAEFMKANEKSGVVSGYAHPSGGGVYRLKNGKTFDLTLEECRSVEIRWDFGKVAP